jgi:aspartyl-tRNA(Asn)/glutamyl-tRNA(Gln) amidotransferase subunit A
MKMPTVVEAARSIRAVRLTSEALTLECIAAIERHNPALNAFVYLDFDAALAEARSVDRIVKAGGALGPLAGIPFGVKDLEHCAGMPTTRGSRWFAKDPNAAVDDIHVARLRKAGAIPIGKTAAPEFGAWAYTASPLLGVTRNPWNTDRTPGGSSGGSSAAVSAGLVPFCTASDGGGSIRTPAAFTGLVGLKCTYGRIPTFGATHIAQNAVVGSLATTVADTALLLDVMAGPDARDRTCLPPPSGSYVAAIDALDVRGTRAAWSLDLGFAIVEPEVAALCERAARTLMTAIDARRVDVKVRLEDYIRTYARIEGVDKFVDIDPDLWQNRLDELDPLIAPGWEKDAHRDAAEVGRGGIRPTQAGSPGRRLFRAFRSAADADGGASGLRRRRSDAERGGRHTRSRRYGGDSRHAREPRESARDHAAGRPHVGWAAGGSADRRPAASRRPAAGSCAPLRSRAAVAAALAARRLIACSASWPLRPRARSFPTS